MSTTKNKTQPTDASVQAHLNAIDDPIRRDDCASLVELMREESGCEPVMWSNIVGFGSYHYRYDSGREGDFMRVGFANRKTALTIYIMTGFNAHPNLMDSLGKYKTGKSCLYVKRLEDIDVDVLRRLVRASLDIMAETYGPESA